MTTYSGDVTLTGGEPTPLALDGPEDVYVHPGSVDGDIELRNVEYVFTGTPVTGGAAVDDPAERVAGDIEDGYVEPGVEGDVRIADAGDVFVGHDAVTGAFSARGPEQVFDAGAADPPERDPATYDVTVSGWRQERAVEDVETGLLVVGSRADVTVTDATGAFDVYLVGTNHAVRVEGDAAVDVHTVGRDATVELGPYVDVGRAVETGFDNAVDVEPVPYEALVETTKAEAYDVTFGRAKVTYQTPAPDEEWCTGCGKEAERIIRRHREDAFFLLGHPIRTYASGSGTEECEHCAARVDASLTPEEREEVFGP